MAGEGEDESGGTMRRLEVAVRAAAIGVWDWNLLTGAFVYSPQARRICGFSPDEPVTREKLAAITHKDDWPRTTALAQRALDPAIRDQELYRYRIKRADTGELRWVLAHGEAIFAKLDGEERATRYIGTLQDITEQKRAEDALSESEARLRLAMEASRMAVWELDVATGAVTHSPELNRLYGFPPEARPSLDEFRALYAPGERERIQQEGMEVRSRGETLLQTEFRHFRLDGSEGWLLMRAQLAPSPSGAGLRVIGVIFDITDRKRAEERRALLVHELNHRVKNTLATVQAIVAQSLRSAGLPREVHRNLDGRLVALAKAHDMLTREHQEGAPLADVVEQAMSPFADGSGRRIAVRGPAVRLSAKAAVAMAMALHELATNATKYGALSSPAGRVVIDWKFDQGQQTLLRMEWREEGGPPVQPPQRKGFGSRLLERSTADALGGAVEFEFNPSGLVCRLTTELARIVP